MNNSARVFTLVELLTVISIIAIVAALILAAVGKAREAGKKIQCVSNLKQNGIVLLSYSSDQGETLPWVYVSAGTDYWYQTIGSKYFNFNINAFTALPIGARSINVLLCPSCAKTSGQGTNYLINGSFSYVPGATRNLPLKKSRQPSMSGLLLEGGDKTGQVVGELMQSMVPFFNYPARIRAGNSYACVAYPHHMTINILYLDGHVSNQKRPAFGQLLNIAVNTNDDMELWKMFK